MCVCVCVCVSPLTSSSPFLNGFCCAAQAAAASGLAAHLCHLLLKASTSPGRALSMYMSETVTTLGGRDVSRREEWCDDREVWAV